MSEAPMYRLRASPPRSSRETHSRVFFSGEETGPAAGVELGGLPPLRGLHLSPLRGLLLRGLLRGLRVAVLRRRLHLRTTNPRGKQHR